MLKAARLAAFSAAALAIICGRANAANNINAQWSFEEGAPFWTPADLTDSAVGPSALAGNGAQTNLATMMGVHASALSDWTTPVGNGSANSYSANNWGVGDYFQFQTSTTSVSDIGLQFDQVSSSTGPRDFKVQYSTDGTLFTDFASYSVQVNAVPSWSGTANNFVQPIGLDTYSFDLTGVSAINNATNLYFRLTNTSTVAARGDTVATTGTDRVDNVTIYSSYDPTMAPVPQPFAAPVAPQAGDIVFGFGGDRVTTTLDLVRGSAVLNGGSKPAPLSPWQTVPFVQRVKFDNLGGTAHNVQGNMLGLYAGSSTGTGAVANPGAIYSFATQGSVPFASSQLLATTTGTRISGLSVAPDNSKIAVASSDNGQVIVYDYTAGNTMGAGASLSGVRQTASTPLTPAVVVITPASTTPQPQGTAWLNNNTVLAISTIGNLYEVDATSMAATLKTTVAPLPSNAVSNTALAYNPAVSPYVFAMLSGFVSSTSQTMLYILDPASNYSVINDVNLSGTGALPAGSSDTGRDIALDASGNLFISANGSKLSFIPGAAANAATLADFSAVPWYTSTTFASFNGFDIGFAPPAGVPGDYNGDTKVNAADYVLWRNDPNAFGGTPAGYNTWRANFGTGDPGSGSGLGGSAAVPEPASVVLLLFGLAALGCRRRAA
jgi:hypothetical protein